MLFTAGMVVRGVGLARLWSWVFGLLSAGAVYAVGRRTLGERAARLSCLLYYTLPMSTMLSGSAYPDQLMILSCLCAFLAFLHWTQEENKIRWLAAAGFCAGLAMSTHYTALGMLPTLALLTLWHWHRVRPFPLGRLIAAAAGAVAAGGLVLSPWFLRNWILRGNPFYPRAFLGMPGDEFFRMLFLTWGRKPGVTTWQLALDLPRQLTMGHVTNGWGPLPSAFLPFLLFLRPWPKSVRQMLLCMSTIMVVNLIFLIPSPRYVAAAFPWAALLISYAILQSWDIASKGARAWLAALLAAGLVVPSLAFPAYFAAKRVPLQLGRMTEDDYLTEKFAGSAFPYDVIQYINEHAPAGSTVFELGLLLGSQYSYPGLRVTGVDAYPVSFYTQPLAQVLSQLKKDNVTYLLYVKNMFRDDRVYLISAPRFEVPVSWFTEGVRQGVFIQEMADPPSVVYRIRYPSDTAVR
jgi:hypothetical protein